MRPISTLDFTAMALSDPSRLATSHDPGAREALTAPLPPLPLQSAMIREARNGDAPWANLEQLVVEDPHPAPPAHVVARALETLIRRHEGLRLVAETGPDGAPRLIPRPRFVPALATRDWSSLPAERQQANLADWLHADRDAGIDIAASPGWRLLLVDLGTRGHACVLSVHHAVMDGPAMAVVMEEFYDLVAGRRLPAMTQPDLRDAIRHLSALPDDLPRRAEGLLGGFDRPARLTVPGTGSTGRMTSQHRRLDAEISAALRQRAVSAGGTFALVQAAWALVIARWTGESDVSFGLTLGGRNTAAGFGRTVGCLIATLPQRVSLADLPDLDSLGTRLRAQTLELRALHGATSDDLRTGAGLAPGMALYDSVLVFSRQSVATRLRALGKGWQARQVRLIEEGDIPLTVAIYDEPELAIELEHDPTCLSAERARRLADHFQQLLTSIARAPDGARLRDLSMLTIAEQVRLARLALPDRTPTATPDSLPDAVAAHARARPSAPALVQGDQRLSRAALDGAVTALARRIDQTVPAGGRVILNLPRGLDYTVAVLACLRSQRVFVPLDPAQPAELRAGLARAVRAAAVIGSAGLPGLDLPLLAAMGAFVPKAEGRRATRPAHGPGAGGLLAPDVPARGAQPDDLAYIIHTSGSTGQPKGVMGRTGALAAHAAAMIDAFALTPADRVLAMAAPGFDVALEEVLPTLVAGATIVVAPPQTMVGIGALLDLIGDERVSVLNLPASLWHLLVDEMARMRRPLPPSVRLVIAGSERVAPGALAKWRQIAPGVAWMNAYGPTEATITALAHAVLPGQPPTDPAQDVPIGRPLGHATAHVLALDGSPAPEGAPGQLWIGGEAVTLGYLDRPQETAAAFRPAPLAAGQAAKTANAGSAQRYATGDWAQWRPDGALTFLGRRDRQVKLRGNRIDLDGIERALSALDGVRAVHVDLDPAGGRLVAWFSGPAASSGPETLARLRGLAAQRLGGVSLPVLVPMTALPLRPNGKTDPARLPSPPLASAPRVETARDLIPAPPRMAEVAALFAEVLNQSAIDPDVDFRDQGGHSLAALRLAGAIEARFGRRTRTTDLYRHPTVRQFAAHLEKPVDGPRYVVPIQPHGTGVPFFAVHVLGEKEILFRPLAEALGPDHPVLGLTMGPPKDPGTVDVRVIAKAYFDDLQRHYPTGPISLGAVSMAAYFAFELAQLLLEAGRDVRLLAIFDASGPGGRPCLRGRAKLVAHLRQIRRKGPRHLAGVVRARLESLRFARDAAFTAPAEVTGASLVLANVRAVEKYTPAPYLGRMVVFRAADSFWDSPEALETALGWTQVARGGLDKFDIPGDHLTILQPTNVDQIAAALSRLVVLD